MLTEFCKRSVQTTCPSLVQLIDVIRLKGFSFLIVSTRYSYMDSYKYVSLLYISITVLNLSHFAASSLFERASKHRAVNVPFDMPLLIGLIVVKLVGLVVEELKLLLEFNEEEVESDS